jgi:hypothetical protein
LTDDSDQSGTRSPAAIDRIIDIARGVRLLGTRDRESLQVVRYPYAAEVAFVEVDRSGTPTSPRVLRSESISTGGLSVRVHGQLSVGGRGAVMLRRSDGMLVVLPARIAYCNVCGDGEYECGLDFEPPPSADVAARDFCDGSGRPPLLPAA